MKNLVYLFIAVFFVSCGGSSMNSTYEKTIKEYLIKGRSNDLGFKVVELTEQGKVTVADSIAYLTDEFRKDKQLIINRVELAKKMTEELKSKTKKKSEFDKYTDDIVVINARIDSLKNLTPDNLQGYDDRNANDVLAVIVRCKYSVQLSGNTKEETFDFYLSPDGTKCYGKKGIQ